MTRFTLTVLLISFFLTTYGQSDNRPKEGLRSYANSFQSYRDKNVDSSLYFVRLLAADPKYSGTLQILLHNVFAQTFQKKWEEEAKDSLQKIELKKEVAIGLKILEGMVADSNRNLVNSAKPIYFWVKIQQNENNNKELIKLTNEFIKTELSVNDIYPNRIGRYAFLIHQVISKKKELSNLAEILFTTTTQKFKSNPGNVDSASRPMLEKKVWYKYLYAYANFIKANQLLKQNKEKEAVAYFKTASDYSPDLTDKKSSNGYFYDMYFLFEKEKITFQDDYLSILIKNSKNNKEALATLLSMALANPVYKENLKSFYDSNFPNQEAFSSFWIKSINENAKPVTHFSLKQLDGNTFSTAKFKDNWILIDFWGTWCAPCRKEHPDLQKFYQSFATKGTSNFSLLTVACADMESKVIAYMTEYNYTFPVAMADNKIEKLYNINSYPSKVLITPQGKYLIIPFGIDWVDFIKKYADL